METNLGTADWMPVLGWVLIILFWALFILGVVAESARDGSSKCARDAEESAMRRDPKATSTNSMQHQPGQRRIHWRSRLV